MYGLFGRRLLFLTLALAGLALAAVNLFPSRDVLLFNTNGDVYAFDMRTALAIPIVQHPDIDFGASWSPDGQQIAFISRRDATTLRDADLYVQPWPLGEPQRLTAFPQPFASRPVWNPDGHYITAVIEQRVVLFDLLADTMTALTTGNSQADSSGWLDNEQVFFFLQALDQDGGRTWRPYTYRIEQGFAIEWDASALPCTRFDTPVLSPDMTQYALICTDYQQLFLIDRATGEARVLVSQLAGQLAAPAWAPDGGRLVFINQQYDHATSSQVSRLMAVSTRTGAVKPLAPAFKQAYTPSWRPR